MSRTPPGPPSRKERRAQARLEPRSPRRRRTNRTGARPQWQSPVVLVSAAALVIGAVLIFLALPKAPASTAEIVTPPVSYPTELIDGTTMGKADAPVSIEIYVDFQCPACKLFVTAQLHRLIDEFVVPGTVRIESRDIAFLGRGTPDESLELAAGTACAAEQDRYWQFHDFVFWNQRRENKGDHDAAFIASVADASGLDRATWDTCFARDDVRTAIKSQTQAAIGKGVSSTPTLVVNGQAQTPGVPDYDKLAALIRQLAGTATPAPGASTAP
jgi:protein-disulfide isomerase